MFDLKSPDLPEQLKITQRVAVRGERSLASGSVCDGTEWMSGTISSFNKKSHIIVDLTWVRKKNKRICKKLREFEI